MEIVKVQKDVFEALNDVINCGYTKDDIMRLHATRKEPKDDWKSGWKPLNELSVSDMAKALFVGYELDRTAEEKIVEYYKMYLEWSKSEDHDVYPEGSHKVEAVIYVLDTLNIQIKGVNA
jgi:hypothetical protein